MTAIAILLFRDRESERSGKLHDFAPLNHMQWHNIYFSDIFSYTGFFQLFEISPETQKSLVAPFKG